MSRSLRFVLVSWLVAFGLYELLAGELSWPEAVVGAAVAAITVGVLANVRAQSTHHFQFPRGSLGKLRRVPLQMLIDCLIVFGAILRRPFLARGSGRFAEREFNQGNEHPASRARRALVTLGITCAPNTFVIGTISPNGKLLVHELVPEKSKTPRDRDWPL
ncbi:MAG TPA: hypothetical protein VHW03_07135 [Chthoniobacterales bacterium]|nr:hypothetical protein [Chthoniobacterales bacterium]